MIYPRLPDGTLDPAWLAVRCGRVTASNVWRIMGEKKDGSPTAEWRSYMVTLLTERGTGSAVGNYTTAAMQWGIDHEADAIAAYEAETGLLVEPGYWIDAGDFGATPDGIVSGRIAGNGLVECKCPLSTTVTRLRYFEADIPPEWRWQMVAQMAAAGAAWCDLVVHDPRFLRVSDRCIIRRLTAAECADDTERMRMKVREFAAEMAAVADEEAW